MKIFKYKGVEQSVGAPFELDGVAYPWNWFDLASEKDLADRGFTVEEVPDPKRQVVTSQEIMAQFSSEDAAAIKKAIDAHPEMFLLWSAFQAQYEPMRVTNERFVQGWTALKQVVGEDRMASIADILNLDIS